MPWFTERVELTAHDVALLRLLAQHVAGQPVATPRDAVGLLTAVQAQDDVGAITSIALRTAARDRAAVVAAYDAGEIVRTWPMRGTLHAVLAEDVAWMLPLMTPGPRTAAATRRPQLGLGEADVVRAHELAATALRDGGALRRSELLAVWADAGLEPTAGRGYHLIVELAQRGVLCLGPFREREQAFVLVDDWVRAPRALPRDVALAELALRYFRGHGPATIKDLMRWAGLPARDLRPATAAVRDQLVAVTVDGVEHLMDPATPDLLATHAAAARDVVLLPGFDEVILGYQDRSMTLDPAYADRIVPGGNGVFRPTVVVDGRVVGTWKHVGTGARRRLEVDAFEPLPDAVTRAVAERYAALPL